jgi:hypothetical protein
MRKCTEWKASRWMCRRLFDTVRYFISQLLCGVKRKVVGVHVFEAYGGSEVIVPLSLLQWSYSSTLIIRVELQFHSHY